ncbi:hypothetical protein D3C87_90340 [compost metagenome]
MRGLMMGIFVGLISIFAQAKPEVRGLRVDPSYFYKLYPRVSAAHIATDVVRQAKSANVNTLFLYAYNAHGSFYTTQYPMTEIEIGMGTLNIFSSVYHEALKEGLKVVAVIPVNDFKRVWTSKTEWRSKHRNGTDYQPTPASYLLSAWHPEFRHWLQGFVDDLTTKFPALYAVEAVEPTVDNYWRDEADFHPIANQEFFRRFPQGTLGDDDWKSVRALGLTELLGLMSERVHFKGIHSAIVHIWPAMEGGNLFSAQDVSDFIGFNFDDVLNLQGPQKIDIITGEFLWQQWASEYGSPIFTPEWSFQAAREFLNFVRHRSFPIIHVEISTWDGKTGPRTPTIEEFQRSLEAIRDISPGIDVYDHSQISHRDAWSALKGWDK